MPQASITINGTPGSDTDLPINTLVQLNNQNIGGESTYLWTILDQPSGPTDVLSSTTIQNPTFTPQKEGTYHIQLIVNQSLADEQVDTVVAGILQLKTRIRQPAAGESTEADSSDGWAPATNESIRLLDTIRSDPGVSVMLATTTHGIFDVTKVTGTDLIKSGLPGEERLPEVSAALATDADIVWEPVHVVLAAVDGGSIVAGSLIFVRNFGFLQNVPFTGAVLNDTVYVDNSGALSRTAGTNTREVGRVVRVPASDFADIYFNGLNGS